MAPRKCGRCRQEGHTRRHCPEMLVHTVEGENTAHAGPVEDCGFCNPRATPEPAESTFLVDPHTWIGGRLRPDHEHDYRWADDENGHSGSFCECGAQESGAPEPVAEEHVDPQPGDRPAGQVGQRNDRWCLSCKSVGHYAQDCTAAAGCPCANGEASDQCSPRGCTVAAVVTDTFTDPTSDTPPETPAAFESDCATCGVRMGEGDAIRATGDGDWECGHHAERVLTVQTVRSHRYDDGNGGVWEHLGLAASCAMPECVEARAQEQATHPDTWSDPAPGTPFTTLLAAEVGDPGTFADPEPAVPAREKTDRKGYRVKDPRTGDFDRWKNGNIKSFTRATTFIKAASDRTALTAWNERNVLRGCAMLPAVAAQAIGVDPESEKGKAYLDSLVDQVAEAAGSKKAANLGTAVHKSIELWAAGVPMEELPEHHVPFVKAYVHALKEYGFRIVPGLVERTVFCPAPGGAGAIVGTFDQVVEHIATGVHKMADVKTGARMDYAWQEYQAQQAIYVAGYTMHGTYVWGESEDEDRWEPPTVKLDTTEAIVFHIPVKNGGENAVCHVLRADLAEGWDHVKLCATVRVGVSKRPKPVGWTPPESEPAVPEPEEWPWEERFRAVKTVAEAGGLWESARSAGVEPMELQRLVHIAQERLRGLESERTVTQLATAYAAATPEPPF